MIHKVLNETYERTIMNHFPLETALLHRGISLRQYHAAAKPLSRNDLITLLK